MERLMAVFVTGKQIKSFKDLRVVDGKDYFRIITIDNRTFPFNGHFLTRKHLSKCGEEKLDSYLAEAKNS